MSATKPQVAANVAEIVGSWGHATPLAPALIAPGRPMLTFAALDRQMQQINAILSSAGVTRIDRVAIALPNGPEMAVAILAVAGCAICAPLNPAYRDEEFRFYLGDLRPKVLLLPAEHDGAARTVAKALGIRCIDVHLTNSSPAGQFDLGIDAATSTALEAACGSDIAMMLHTSGTTSRPKIVPLTHRNLCRSATNIASALALGPTDRCLNLMPLFHVHGFVAALLASLSAGGSVACTRGLEAGKLVAWVDELQPTWYTAVPTIHQAVLEQLRRNPARSIRGRLRFARSSSAALPPSVARELEAALGAPVIEAYGMTEAAHQIASNPLPPALRKPGSVGLPTGTDIAIFGEDGQRLGHGQIGEIAIRGENVTPGYDSNPEANATAFVDGWFRTGDQGWIDADGYLSITGRLKEIINRGGEKISPREIDEALVEHPAVRQAVAFAVPHPTLGEDIAAAVALRGGCNVTEEDLRNFLFGRLAEFKIPSRLLIIDAIPTGATGKIQRIGLAERLASELAFRTVPPRDEIERLVAECFAEVLDCGPVGATHNFFSLGGDSLCAGQVLARIEAMLGVALPPAVLFRSPTVGAFAREIRGARNAAS